MIQSPSLSKSSERRHALRALRTLRSGAALAAIIGAAFFAGGCERENVPHVIDRASATDSTAQHQISVAAPLTIVSEPASAREEHYFPARFTLHENATHGNVVTFERD